MRWLLTPIIPFMMTFYLIRHSPRLLDQNTGQTTSLNIVHSLDYETGPRVPFFWQRDDSVVGSPYFGMNLAPGHHGTPVMA